MMSGTKLDDPWFERFVSQAEGHDDDNDDKRCCSFSPPSLSFRDINEVSKESKWLGRHGFQRASSSFGERYG